MSQLRKYYARNRKRLCGQRAAKCAAMRAAKERKRLELTTNKADSESGTPDIDHVDVPKRPRAEIEIRVRILDRSWSISSHLAPWPGYYPSKAQLLQFVRTTLELA